MATLAQEMPPAASATPPPLEEDPPVTLKRDADGKLVQFPGLTYDQYRELMERVNNIGAGAAVPRYTIYPIACRGEALGHFARLEIQFDLQLQSEGWVGIPLRLDEAVLDNPEVYSGGGQHFLEFPERGVAMCFGCETPSISHASSH